MSQTKTALTVGLIIACGVSVYTAESVYREYTLLATVPDVSNKRSPYHILADQATTMDHLQSQLCEVMGWNRIVIFGPYQNERSFRAVGMTNSKLIAKLESLSGIRENWHLVAIDEYANVIDAQIVGWGFVPEANKGVIIVDSSDCK